MWFETGIVSQLATVVLDRFAHSLVVVLEGEDDGADIRQKLLRHRKVDGEAGRGESSTLGGSCWKRGGEVRSGGFQVERECHLLFEFFE